MYFEPKSTMKKMDSRQGLFFQMIEYYPSVDVEKASYLGDILISKNQ
jgi:hypothetical protein